MEENINLKTHESKLDLSMEDESPHETLSHMNLDELYHVIGEIGKYQLTVLFLVGLICFIPALITYGYVFFGGTPEHRCKLPNYENDTFKIQSDNHQLLVDAYIPKDEADKSCYLFQSNSSVTYKCNQYVYSDEYYGTTVVTKWNLVCSNQALKSLFSTIFFVGFYFVIVLGAISDRYGRRTALFLSLMLNLVSNFATAFTTLFLDGMPQLQQILYAILRLLSGMSTTFYSAAFVLGIEIVGPKYRALAGSIFYYIYISGELVNILISYFIRDISSYYVFLSLLTLLFCVSLFFVPESPRYLYTNGKKTEANKTFLRIARSNKREKAFIEFTRKYEEACLIDSDTEKSDASKVSFINGLKSFMSSRHLILEVIATIVNWLANSFVYYGVSLNTGSLSGNPYKNATYAALVEFVGVALCHFMISRFGRKYPYTFFMFLSGTSLVFVQFLDHENILVLVLAMICKLSISFTYNTVYIVTAESYPTSIRATILTLCNSMSRFGAVLAPMVQHLNVYSHSLPFVVYGSVSLVATIFHLLFIRETKDKVLADDLEQELEQELELDLENKA